MNHQSSGGGGSVVIGAAIVLLLALGGAGSWWLMVRQHQAAAVALEQARRAEADAVADAALAAAEADEPSERSEPSEPDADAAIRAAVESVLRKQQDAWNRGDVDAFVEHYWKSDDVTFSGGGATTRGWEATARRYRQKYPTRETMGQLAFSNLEITPLGPNAALVLGEWALDRDDDPVSGNFTLVFRQLDGRWVIVHDHTSRSGE